MDESPPTILRTADLRRAGLDDRALRHGASRGELQRVAPGCYVTAAAWSRLAPRERYEVSARARLAGLSSHLVASHDTAAALWRFPALDGWPPVIHVVDPSRERPLTRNGLARHIGLLSDGDVALCSGHRVTTPARTALDLALRDGYVVATMLFDHVLRHHGVGPARLHEMLHARPLARRRRAVEGALEGASALAESPGESISRAQMVLLGFEPPELQRRFVENGREVARTDFWWSSVGVAGEFDGAEKYLSADLRGGRSAEQVVLDEKWRSEELLDRHEVRRIVRWNYRIARSPELLADRLTRAGVPRARRVRRPAVSA